MDGRWTESTEADEGGWEVVEVDKMYWDGWVWMREGGGVWMGVDGDG